ncbi:MAG: hypothetical protein GC154_18910 [bacterium]|nr:hypothetical protein [bacterium]
MKRVPDFFLMIFLIVIACFMFCNPGWGEVVINEIHYDPADWDDNGGALREFIELYNSGDASVDLSGYEFTDGIDYRFPQGTTLSAHGYLVVARYPSHSSWRNRPFSILGPYDGKLSNDGERITLSSPGGITVDSVAYLGVAPWPKGPNGYGSSLERISPFIPSDDYHSWRASLNNDGTPGAQNTVVNIPPRPTAYSVDVIPAHPTSSDDVKIRMFFDGPELIDSATLRWEAGGSSEPAENSLISYSDRWLYWKGTSSPSNGLEWTQPEYSTSQWSIGYGGFGYGDTDLVETLLDDMRGNYSTVYLRKTFQVQSVNEIGSLVFSIDYDDGFIAYLNGKEIARVNAPADYTHESIASGSHESGQIESFEVGDASQFLKSGDNVLAVVGFNLSLGNSSDFVLAPSLKASNSGDGGTQRVMTLAAQSAEMAVYEATVPAMSNQTLVRYNVRLRLKDGNDLYLPHYREPHPFYSYFVYDHDVESLLPIVWMMPDVTSRLPEQAGSYSAVAIKPQGSNDVTVYDGVGITIARSGTKLKFIKGEEFEQNRTLNFSLESPPEGTTAGGQSPHVEHISYRLFRDFGVLTEECKWYRVITRGKHEQRIAVQQPNEQFLKINGRDPDGNIYKIAYNEPGGYSKKTNLDEDDSDYRELFNKVSIRNRTDLEASIHKYLDYDEVMGYQVATFLLSHWDGIKNNIFLYHDPDEGGKWEIIPWDVDKTFGYTDSDPMYWRMPIDFFITLQAPGSPELTNRNLDGPISRPFHSIPAIQQEFVTRVASALNGLFSQERVEGMIDDAQAMLLEDLDLIESYTGRPTNSRRNQILNSYETMRYFLSNRHAFLRTQLPADFLLSRKTPASEYSEGDTISPITLEIVPNAGVSVSGVWTETIPAGFSVSNVKVNAGETSLSNGVLVWTLNNVTQNAQLNYDLTAPEENTPSSITLHGDFVSAGQNYAVADATLKYRPGNLHPLGPDWVTGSGGSWYIANNVMVCFSEDGYDPKHVWVNKEFGTGDYTVKADVRMVDWQDQDLARAGVAVRVNPSDGERALNLLFHDDTNSIDMLNDLVAWGAFGDFSWEPSQWYTMTLSAHGSVLDGEIHPRGNPSNSLTIQWDSPMLEARSPGYPGLTGSSLAGLTAEFDNFSVSVNGEIVFEDDFDIEVSVSDWGLY